MKIKKGDTVKILYGKDSGKSGSVVAVLEKEQKLVVSGLNIYKKHVKGDGKNKVSEILTIEKPLPISKVIFVCPLCNKTTRISLKREGKKITRICKKCGKEIEAKKETKVETKKTDKKETKSKKTKKE
jgi:large subunit ribosomal protein L24